MRHVAKSVWVFLLVGVFAMGVLLMGMASSIETRSGDLSVRHMADIPADVWAKLSDTTFFFGHQSVGNNILDGVRDLVASHELVNLEIVRAGEDTSPEGSALIHAAVGRNREPLSKIAAFKESLESGLGEKVDIAFLKFCYVDIVRYTDPNALLTAYGEAIEALKTRFPNVRFVHFTVPLCAPPRTAKGVLKTNIKRLLGRSTVLDDNAVRQRYNELLRKRFSGKEPLFDLARYEALGPDGQEHFCQWKGEQIPVLVGSYTDDGGHLNAVGRRYIAEQLLIELLEVAQAME